MPANSILSAFSLGLQADAATAATLYTTAIATQSGGDVEFDERESEPEHPGPASRSTARKFATERTGYLSPVNATVRLRPRIIPRLFQAMGFAVVTGNDTTHYTHTIKIANDAAMGWMSAIHKMSNGSADLIRLFKQVRGETLTFNWDAAAGTSNAEFAGVGLTEGNAAGTETLSGEIDVPLSAYTGSIVTEHANVAVTTTTRTESMTITQELERNDRQLHAMARAGLPRLSLDITGTFGGVDIDQGTYEWYKRIKRGSTGGTAPSLNPTTGELVFSYASLENIAGAAVPYSITVTLPEVEYTFETPSASGSDLIRADINWAMLDTSSDCITVVVVNDVAHYAAVAP